MRQYLSKAWAAVKSFVAKHWKAIVLGLLAVVALIIWRRIKVRISSLLDGLISRQAKWSKIPGVETHVVAINPNTGKPETIELPMGVKARDVESVGITSAGGTYEVARLHTPTDYHGDPTLDDGGSLDI